MAVDPAKLEEIGQDEAARELADLQDAEQGVGFLKRLPTVRRAARLHREARITTGKLLEVLLVAIDQGQDPASQRLPQEDDDRA